VGQLGIPTREVYAHHSLEVRPAASHTLSAGSNCLVVERQYLLTIQDGGIVLREIAPCLEVARRNLHGGQTNKMASST
jgi:hypothetical protein